MARETTITGTKTDAIEMLKTDHRMVEDLFKQFERAGNDAGLARHAAEEIIRELSVHAAVEEQLLYPLMRKVDPAESGLVDHSLEEHQQVKELLAQIDGRPADDPDVRQVVQELKAAVEEHVSDEEGQLFPALRRHVSEKELAELGERMAKAKGIAPTHPHPKAPNTPPGNIIAGPMAAMVDKVRDALRS